MSGDRTDTLDTPDALRQAEHLVGRVDAVLKSPSALILPPAVRHVIRDLGALLLRIAVDLEKLKP